MGFLQKFFTSVFHENAGHMGGVSSFEPLSDDELETHLRIDKYDQFRLTGAVRPSYDLKVKPSQGFRHDVYKDEESGANVPVLMISASAEILFDLFIKLLEPLGGSVDVVLETSHSLSSEGHEDLYRENIDMPVLQSTLYEFEDLLTNDGCTGVAVVNPSTPQEVQLDEHKILIVYGEPLQQYEEILAEAGVHHNPEMGFITEAEHVHSSTPGHSREFEELKVRLGIDNIF